MALRTAVLAAWVSSLTQKSVLSGFNFKGGMLSDLSLKPQPWEHLAKVLRDMGHSEEARRVAIAKHHQMRDAKRYIGGSKLWDWLYGHLVGYGYRPWTLVKFVLAVWFGCTLVYWPAVNPQWFGAKTHLISPSKPSAELSCEINRMAEKVQKPCPKLRRGYSNFFVPAYSAEVLLPVISLGYKHDWRPVVSTPEGKILPLGWIVMSVYWFQIVFGWVASLMLIAAVGTS